MTGDVFPEAIAGGSPPAPVCLFLGEADLLMEEAWERLLAARTEKGRGAAPERLHARECPAADVMERARTLSMFGGRRYILVLHVEEWPKADLALAAEYAARPSPAATVVFTAPGRKGVEGLLKAVQEHGAVVTFAPPSEAELPGWVLARARERGKRMATAAARLLVDMVGGDLGILESEIERLSLYAGEAPALTEDHVREVCARSRAAGAFEVLRHVGERRGARAVSALRSLLSSGEQPLRFLGLLASHVRRVWQAREILDAGTPERDAAAALKLPPFIARQYISEARRFTERDLYALHRALREADLAMKSTGLPDETILEALVLRLATQKSP